MSIHIDPHALQSFAEQAAGHSHELHSLRLNIGVDKNALGQFAEADLLVTTLNKHTVEVNQRLQATSEALLGLAKAASHAATLSGAADSDIAKQMKTINRTVDDARRKLIPPSS